MLDRPDRRAANRRQHRNIAAAPNTPAIAALAPSHTAPQSPGSKHGALARSERPRASGETMATFPISGSAFSSPFRKDDTVDQLQGSQCRIVPEEC